MKNVAWRYAVVLLCAVGTAVAVLNVADVLGLGSKPPWLGTSPPLAGRWGAYFGASGQRERLKVFSVEQDGPAARADVKKDDLIDISPSNRVSSADSPATDFNDWLVKRFWLFYRTTSGKVVDLSIIRNVEHRDVSFPTRMVTGSALSSFAFLPNDCGSALLFILAIYFANRGPIGRQNITFATLLALLGLGIVADPASFGTPWSGAYVVLALLSLALPLSIACWAYYASRFGRPDSPARKRLTWICYSLVAIAIVVDVARWWCIVTARCDPVPLVFSWLAYAPLICAAFTAFLCAAAAAGAARGEERKTAAISVLPLATIYGFVLTTSIVARYSPSYRISHNLLLLENLVLLVVPLILICAVAPDAVLKVCRVALRPFVKATQWIEGQPNSLLAWGLVGFIALFLYVFVQDLSSEAIFIGNITVPKDLSDRGFSSTTASLRIRDAINSYVRVSQTALKPEDIFTSTDQTAVVVPSIGLPVDFIAALFAKGAGRPRPQVNGEFTEGHGGLELRLRLTDQIHYSDQVIFDRFVPLNKQSNLGGIVDDLITVSPACVLIDVEPYLVAAHVYNEERDDGHYTTPLAFKLASHIVNTADPATDEDSLVFSHFLIASIYAGITPVNEQDIAREIDKATDYGESKVSYAWRGRFFISDYERLKQYRSTNLILRARVRGNGAGPLRNVRARCKISKLNQSLAKVYDASKRDYSCGAMEDAYLALYDLNQSLNLDPKYAIARDFLGVYYEQLALHEANPITRLREYQQAFYDLKLATDIEPDRAQHWRDLADYFETRRAYRDERSVYDSLIEYRPDTNLRKDLTDLTHELGGFRQASRDPRTSQWLDGELNWIAAERKRESAKPRFRPETGVSCVQNLAQVVR